MNLSSLTIQEAAAGLREKKFSAVELAQSCLDSIKKYDGGVHAYTTVCEKSALEEARAADSLFASGKAPSVLTGIPVALKDVFCTKGINTTAASNILKDFKPAYDATVVKKLAHAGMVMLGKTNTDELTCGSSTETSCYGTTHNPWDLERTPGGSSGGSSAAIAADECIYSLGTDTGGSIRQPAAYCGITGLKVTYGRVSRFGVISMASSLDTVGPMTKTVWDAAAVLQEIAGHDDHDTTTPKVPVDDYLGALANADVAGMTIGLPKEYFIAGTDPEVDSAVRAAIDLLVKKGAKIKEISLPHSPYGLAVYYVLSPSEVSANMSRYDGIRMGPGPSATPKDLEEYYYKTRGEGFGSEIKRRIMIGTYTLSSGYYDAYYTKAQKVRTLVIRDFEEAFKDVDVIITPVTPSTAFKIGEHANDPVKMYLEDIFTVSANVAGLPGLAVPVGFGSNKMPIGMQIIGPHFSEAKLLQVGHVYQQATEWHTARAM